MKNLAAALCALALIATGAQAQTVKDFLAAVTKKWTTPFEPFQLIGNIYYVGTDGIAVYIIKTSQGLILMDTALPESTGMIKDSIAKLGFKVADIKIILNTPRAFRSHRRFCRDQEGNRRADGRRRARQAAARGWLLSGRREERRSWRFRP